MFSLVGCTVAYANSGPPKPSDGGRGIVFEKHDKVKIVNEVLDIDMLENTTAKVTAIYNMKNTSSESLSVKSMFLYPLSQQYVKEVKVLRDNVALEYDVEYYGTVKEDININNDWETILSENNNNSRPFDDGTGFVEYTFSNMDKPFKFIAEDYYFVENLTCRSTLRDKLTPINGYIEYKIITRQTLYLEDFEYTSEEVANIYDYIEDYYKNIGYYDLLATTASKSIFYNIDKNNKSLNKVVPEESSEELNDNLSEEVNEKEPSYFNSLNSNYSYNYLVGAIIYNVDFAPDETVRVVVKYDYVLGNNNNSKQFNYYLTPAKYWQDFGGIEINVHLHKDYTRITSSSLKFTKTDKLTYQYSSNTLPQEELSFTLKPPLSQPGKYPGFLSAMLFLPYIIIIVIVIVIILVIVVALFRR